MKRAYERAKDEVMKALEGICRVEAPSSEYLAALEEIREEVTSWFEASVDAARDDVRRQEDG